MNAYHVLRKTLRIPDNRTGYLAVMGAYDAVKGVAQVSRDGKTEIVECRTGYALGQRVIVWNGKISGLAPDVVNTVFV
jgi:hypothetical protein